MATPPQSDTHAGEVLGLAGLVGSGRTELARPICAADPKTSGEVILQRTACLFGTPKDAINSGVAYLTEDRKAQGRMARTGDGGRSLFW